MARSSLDRRIDAALGGPQRPPYAEFALTLHVFITRLRRALEQAGAETVLFCAREGQLLTRLYDLHSESVERARPAVPAEYFLVSRRSTLAPSLAPIDQETFDGLRRTFPDLTVGGFLHSLALSEAAAASNADLDAPFDPHAVRADPVIRSVYEEHRSEQRDLFERYVDGLVGAGADVHMVDVGWRGSIQDHVARAFEGRRRVSGYYLGLAADRPIANADLKRALLFGPRPADLPHYRVLGHFKAMWEYVLAADHGSVARYEDDGEHVTAVLDVNDVERGDFERVVADLQRGLCQVFERLCEIDDLTALDDERLQLLVAQRHSRMLFFPTERELEIAWTRGHYANFGNPWVKENPAPVELSARRRLQHLAEIVRNPRIVFARFPPIELHRRGLDPLIPAVGAMRYLREFGPPGRRPPW